MNAANAPGKVPANMNDTLQVSTPSDREILMTRTFNARRPLVWDAMTKPEILKRWLFGPPGWTMTLCDEDLRPGGSFRWAWRGPDGTELVMRGTYREVTPPQRVVRTESFEVGCAPQAGEQLATIVLTEEGARTRVTITLLYPSKEARDATIASGMSKGVEAGYDRLAELLPSLAQ